MTGAPTPYAGVNAALAELVERVAARLGDNLVGAYLQGSFALGDFTPNSDVDVLLVIKRDVAERDIEPFQVLHRALFETLPAPWGQRIELSYAPIELLRRWSSTPRDPPQAPRAADWRDPSTGAPPKAYPFWYLNNGANELVRSEHDNSRVVRWVTREKGVVLVGPDPRTLIDPVAPDALLAEVRDTLAFVAKRYPTPEAIDAAWLQAFFVTFCCRALHTLATGEITSKKAATAWAIDHLESRWRPLVETAWTQWRDARASLGGPADPRAARQTLALIRHTVGVAGSAP